LKLLDKDPVNNFQLPGPTCRCIMGVILLRLRQKEFKYQYLSRDGTGTGTVKIVTVIIVKGLGPC
jgi:hypothetical protein